MPAALVGDGGWGGRALTSRATQHRRPDPTLAAMSESQALAPAAAAVHVLRGASEHGAAAAAAATAAAAAANDVWQSGGVSALAAAIKHALSGCKFSSDNAGLLVALRLQLAPSAVKSLAASADTEEREDLSLGSANALLSLRCTTAALSESPPFVGELEES